MILVRAPKRRYRMGLLDLTERKWTKRPLPPKAQESARSGDELEPFAHMTPHEHQETDEP